VTFASSLEINGRTVGGDAPSYIVAEIGQNHNGDPNQCTALIKQAVNSGCDAVKFQVRNCHLEYPASVLDAPHPDQSAAFGATYGEHREFLDFGPGDVRHFAQRIQYNEWPIHWFATPCYIGAVEPLMKLGAPCFKIASKDLTNLDLIEEVARTEKPIILSTGMDGLDEIENALNVVATYHRRVIVLQCTSAYPCANEDVHLAAMYEIRDTFEVMTGFSDHTSGITLGPVAVAMGAVMIEKHITLNRLSKGTDHMAALEPHGLDLFVRNIRATEAALGHYHKERLAVTDDCRRKLRGNNVE